MAGAPALAPATLPVRRRLAALARRYHAAGWMLGTSGNLSARVRGDDRPTVVVTASGRDKGALGDDDFVRVAPSGALVAAGEGQRPSAETSIHLAVYRRLPETAAVLHVHTPASTVVGADCEVEGRPALQFRDLEMIKGWDLWEADAEATLPVFPNHPDVTRIADDLEAWLSRPREVPAMLIAGHGITAWGDTLDTAHRHLEVTEFLCRVARERARP
ncbi:MAG: methylthioribulose 1-phosphate dehydratase [Myxococcota bacterium]